MNNSVLISWCLFSADPGMFISLQTSLGLGWMNWNPSVVPPSRIRGNTGNTALGEAVQQGWEGCTGTWGQGVSLGQCCGGLEPTAFPVYQWELRVAQFSAFWLPGRLSTPQLGGRLSHTWPTAPGRLGVQACREGDPPPSVEQFGRAQARTNSVAFKTKNFAKKRGSFHNDKGANSAGRHNNL